MAHRRAGITTPARILSRACVDRHKTTKMRKKFANFAKASQARRNDLATVSNFTQASQVALVQTINSRFRASKKFDYDREITIFEKTGAVAPLQT